MSTKDVFRFILVLVAHYDLKLHQMDVKIVFLNEDLQEDIYMKQQEGYEIKGVENMICKLKKSIYGILLGNGI